MQLLNNYVANLTQGHNINASRVTFWVIEGDSFSRVDAELPPYGSLGPLFHAFGLISVEELRNGSGAYIPGELHHLSPEQGSICSSYNRTEILAVLKVPSLEYCMSACRSK